MNEHRHMRLLEAVTEEAVTQDSLETLRYANTQAIGTLDNGCCRKRKAKESSYAALLVL